MSTRVPYLSGLFSRFFSPHLPSLFSVTVSGRENRERGMLIVTRGDVSAYKTLAHPFVFI